VLLHGYRRSCDALTDRLDQMDPDGRFLAIVPRAPFEHRDPAIWHRPMAVRAGGDAQLLASLRALDALLGRLQDDLELTASDAVVGGFDVASFNVTWVEVFPAPPGPRGRWYVPRDRSDVPDG